MELDQCEWGLNGKSRASACPEVASPAPGTQEIALTCGWRSWSLGTPESPGGGAVSPPPWALAGSSSTTSPLQGRSPPPLASPPPSPPRAPRAQCTTLWPWALLSGCISFSQGEEVLLVRSGGGEKAQAKQRRRGRHRYLSHWNSPAAELWTPTLPGSPFTFL